LIRPKSNRPVRKHNMALICGDGRTLQDELQLFRRFGVEHDAFCVGRSLQSYIPFVAWAPATVNYVWLDEQMFTYARDQVEDYVVKHSVFFDDKLKPAIDMLWTDTEGSELMEWDGTSAFFALQVALWMNYPKILLCGVPLNNEQHWYDDPEAKGPEWNPETLRAWGRFSGVLHKRDDRDRIRSSSGYTRYLFGGPNVGWLTGRTGAKNANARADRKPKSRGTIDKAA
jgi:hypothetical protein